MGGAADLLGLEPHDSQLASLTRPQYMRTFALRRAVMSSAHYPKEVGGNYS